MEKAKLSNGADTPPHYHRVDQGVLDRVGVVADTLTYYGLAIKGQLDVAQLEEAWYNLARKWPVLLARQVNPKTKRPCEHTSSSTKATEKGRKKARRAPWFLEIPLDEHIDDVIAEQRDAGVPTLTTAHHQGSFNDKLHVPAPSELSAEQPSIIQMRDDLELWVPKAPGSVKEVVGSRKGHRPLLHLEANVYHDATIIGISSPHAFMDALGLAEILRAWTKVLAGRGDEVKPLEGLGSDIFSRYYKLPPHAPSGWSENSLFGVLKLGWTMLCDNFRRPPWKVQNRTIYLPAAFLAKLKAQCTEEIKKLLGDEYDASRDWISTSDALNAWGLRMAQAPHQNKSDIIGYLATRNLRLSAPDPLPEPYLFNALVLQVLGHIPVSEIFQLSMGALALRFRRQMQVDMGRERTRAIISWLAATLHGYPLPLPSNARPFCITNWSRAKLFDVDFTSALIGSSDISPSASTESADQSAATSVTAADEEASPCSIGARGRVYYVGGSSKVPLPMKDLFTVRGIDSTGGMWLSLILNDKEWHHPDGLGPYLLEPAPLAKKEKNV